MEGFSRRIALERFAAVTTAAWLGGASAFAAPGRRLQRVDTLRALVDTRMPGMPRGAVRAVERRMAQDPRYARWANLVLETLEHAPDGPRFSRMSREHRRRALRRWYTTIESSEAVVFEGRQSDASEPELLAASTAKALAAIAKQQAECRETPCIREFGDTRRANGGPLGSEVRRLRHLRGAAGDLLR